MIYPCVATILCFYLSISMQAYYNLTSLSMFGKSCFCLHLITFGNEKLMNFISSLHIDTCDVPPHLQFKLIFFYLCLNITRAEMFIKLYAT